MIHGRCYKYFQSRILTHRVPTLLSVYPEVLTPPPQIRTQYQSLMTNDPPPPSPCINTLGEMVITKNKNTSRNRNISYRVLWKTQYIGYPVFNIIHRPI